MKHNWEYKKLGEVCDIKTGKLDANAASPNGEYPFFTCSKETLRIDNYSYDEECVLIAGNGDLNVKYYNGKFDAYQRTYIITLKDIPMPISMTYLYMFFSKYIEHLRQICIGGVIKYIKLNNLTDTLIPLPPLPVQERIVEELDRLSLILEKKKQQIKELDSLAQSIFYDMFGDPIENEKGWEMKPISEIARFYNGKAHEQAIDEKGEYVLVNSKFISSNGMIKKRTNLQLCPLFINDITMVMSDVPNGKALAKCYLIDKDNIYTLNQRICVFRDYQILPQYLLFALNRNKYFLNFNDGNGQTNLRKNEVEKCPIQMPPLDLQQSFAKKIEAIEKQKELINQSIKEVQLLFDAKMDYYFGD